MRDGRANNNSSCTKPSILVVEDDELIRCITARMLENLNCKVDTAADGFSALLAIKKSYNLILLDIMLPDINGVEVCKCIKRAYSNFFTPIIAHTSSGYLLESQCKEIGIAEMVAKPLSPDKCVELLTRWIPSYIPPNKPCSDNSTDF